nr:unnamed protein product [Digitaria exilis]
MGTRRALFHGSSDASTVADPRLPAPGTSNNSSHGLEDIRKLERTMHRINAALQDAEDHWNIRDEVSKLRLRELKQVAYDAQDIVEEYEYSFTRFKIQASDGARSSIKGYKRKREGTMPPYNLAYLPHQQSWLFKKTAFQGQEGIMQAKIVEIGQKIFDKCKGLPLAIKALGSMLRYEPDEERWNDVLENEVLYFRMFLEQKYAPLGAAFPSATRIQSVAGRATSSHGGGSRLHEMEAASAKRRPAASAKRKPAARLTDELLVEILRRLPVRSVCRFKCVSRSWRNLISNPAHRKKLPQTLAGFFYRSWNWERFPRSARHFTNITGKGRPFIVPSFSFLPVPSDNVTLLDSCNGLLLCRCFGAGDASPPFHYVVCNPATKKWVMLPDGSGEDRTACLGFDPAVSSHFHVVEYVLDEEECVTGVEIYSSKTAAWSFKDSEWDSDVSLYDDERSAFLNGFMHMLTSDEDNGNHVVVMVDMEGKTWRTIPVPTKYFVGSIHQYQGRLCFLNIDNADASKLSIWILKDHAAHEWTPKHSVRIQFLFPEKDIEINMNWTLITFHPECNLIYFVYGWDDTLIAYEMDRKEVRVIRKLGNECSGPYLPYVPLFTEALADG